MSERTPYERLRELHAVLSEQVDTTVDLTVLARYTEDRDAIGAALLVAEEAQYDFKTPETEAAIAVFFGRPPPRKRARTDQVTKSPVASAKSAAPASAWSRWWDLTNSRPIMLGVVLLIAALTAITMWVTKP